MSTARRGTPFNPWYTPGSRAGRGTNPVREGCRPSSVFSPLTVLTEAKQQKQLSTMHVPAVCVLDPDGDIIRWLRRTGRGIRSETRACYHTNL